MPIKGDKGASRNQPQESGAKDTQRTVDAWPEMDPNRPADSQTTGRQSRAGSSVRRGGTARYEHPFVPQNQRERGEHRSPGAPKPPPHED